VHLVYPRLQRSRFSIRHRSLTDTCHRITAPRYRSRSLSARRRAIKGRRPHRRCGQPDRARKCHRRLSRYLEPVTRPSAGCCVTLTRNEDQDSRTDIDDRVVSARHGADCRRLERTCARLARQ